MDRCENCNAILPILGSSCAVCAAPIPSAPEDGPISADDFLAGCASEPAAPEPRAGWGEPPAREPSRPMFDIPGGPGGPEISTGVVNVPAAPGYQKRMFPEFDGAAQTAAPEVPTRPTAARPPDSALPYSRPPEARPPEAIPPDSDPTAAAPAPPSAPAVPVVSPAPRADSTSTASPVAPVAPGAPRPPKVPTLGAADWPGASGAATPAAVAPTPTPPAPKPAYTGPVASDSEFADLFNQPFDAGGPSDPDDDEWPAPVDHTMDGAAQAGTDGGIEADNDGGIDASAGGRNPYPR